MALHMKPVDETLQAGEEGKRQRAEAVESAKNDLEEALKAQKQQANAFEAAWQAQEDDKKALENARQAVADLKVQTKSIDKALYEAQAEQEVFEEYGRKPFLELREKTTPEPEPVEPEHIDTDVAAV